MNKNCLNVGKKNGVSVPCKHVVYWRFTGCECGLAKEFVPFTPHWSPAVGANNNPSSAFPKGCPHYLEPVGK